MRASRTALYFAPPPLAKDIVRPCHYENEKAEKADLLEYRILKTAKYSLTQDTETTRPEPGE